MTDRHEQYRVEFKAEIKRYGRMQYTTEISIPCRSAREAALVRDPVMQMMISAVQKKRRRERARRKRA